MPRDKHLGFSLQKRRKVCAFVHSQRRWPFYHGGLTVKELKTILKSHGLPSSGTKDSLLARMDQYDAEQPPKIIITYHHVGSFSLIQLTSELRNMVYVQVRRFELPPEYGYLRRITPPPAPVFHPELLGMMTAVSRIEICIVRNSSFCRPDMSNRRNSSHRQAIQAQPWSCHPLATPRTENPTPLPARGYYNQ